MSGTIVVDKFTLLQGGPLPPQLEGYITPSEYAALCSSYQQCEASTTCAACACEICICIFTGFICIFCLHPCISIAGVDMSMRSRIHRFNTAFYNGYRVMRLTGGGSIAFDMGELQRAGRMRRNPGQQPGAETVAVVDGHGHVYMVEATPADARVEHPRSPAVQPQAVVTDHYSAPNSGIRPAYAAVSAPNQQEYAAVQTAGTPQKGL